MKTERPLSKRRVLLIMPPFYEYKDYICRELENQEWTVDWISDTVALSFFGKIINKMNRRYSKKRFDAYFRKVIENVKTNDYSKILIIFGAPFLKCKHIAFLKSIFPKAEVIYYAWDSTTSFPNIAELLTSADVSYTFDEDDSLQYKAFFLPLFYVKTENLAYTEPKYLISTIMSFYIEKKENFFALLDSISDYNNCFFYLRVKDRIQRLLLKIKMKNDYKRIKKYIHLESLSFSESSNIINQSQIVLDCPLPTQRGLTMRVFEALSVHKKIITTNESIKKYSFYHPDNIFVINKDCKIPNSFFEKPFNDKHSLSNEYEISSFVRRLMQ